MLIFKVMFIPQILYPLVPWGFDPCPYGKVEAPYQRKNYSVPHSALKHPPSINACIKGHLKNNQLFPSLHPLNLTIHPRSNLNHSAGLYRSLWWQLTCPPLWYLKIPEGKRVLPPTTPEREPCVVGAFSLFPNNLSQPGSSSKVGIIGDIASKHKAIMGTEPCMEWIWGNQQEQRKVKTYVFDTQT